MYDLRSGPAIRRAGRPDLHKTPEEELHMDDTSRGQVTRSAAEVYEEFFVPALFQKWAPRMAEAARLAPGQKVLDVACGTGVLAREAATRVAPGGSVAGLDRNEGMLAVARLRAPAIEWRMGRPKRYVGPDGTVAFSAPAHIATAVKP